MDLDQRIEAGYTLSIYGDKDTLIKQMQSDIEELNEIRELERGIVRIKKGRDLEFISRIKRDGSGVEKRFLTKGLIKIIQEDNFRMETLSISEGTFIANGFNSYVVRLKK